VILAELRDVFDQIELAEWFVRPNSLLEGEIPLGVLAFRPDSVLQAARIDRFVAIG